MNEIKTLMGYTIEDALVELDKEYPSNAYKSAGKFELTDISPAYITESMTKVFGLFGYGWGVRYNPENAEQTKVDSGWAYVLIKQAEFFYKIQVGEMIDEAVFTVNGGSKNKDIEHAWKGAVTNCITHGISRLCVQLSVYKGLRSHKDGGRTRSDGSKSQPKAEQPKQESSGFKFMETTVESPKSGEPVLFNEQVYWKNVSRANISEDEALQFLSSLDVMDWYQAWEATKSELFIS